MTPIKCQACGTLFGIEHEGVLNIKHRDLFRQIIGGEVKGPCRRCGATVVWKSNDDNQRTR